MYSIAREYDELKCWNFFGLRVNSVLVLDLGSVH